MLRDEEASILIPSCIPLGGVSGLEEYVRDIAVKVRESSN